MMICDAIQNKRMLSFVYEGYNRVIEPHTHGVDKKGHQALRAYQVTGGSESGEYVGWKMFHVSEIKNIRVLENQFFGPRDGYKRGDKAFDRIQCQL
jgi:predicted DNA-binding transcriptional regulator YafY